MLDERQLADLMHAEVDSAERPTARLDVDRAMSTGRRQRRYRQVAGAALAVGLLVAGGVTVPSLLAPERPPTTGPADAGPPTAAAGLPAALTTVDPEVVYVRFGWLPDGMRSLQYQSGLLLSGPGVHLSAVNSPPGELWRGVTVNLYPKGVQPSAPQRDSGEPATLTGTRPGPELNGAPSAFATYSNPDRPEAILRWRYAPDGWAQVRTHGVPGDPAQTAERVASTLVFGHEVLPMPVTVPEVPKNLRPITGNVSLDLGEPGSWNAYTEWSPEPADADPGRQRARTLMVAFTPYRLVTDPTDKAYVDPNTTLDGHQARFGGQDGVESLIVYDVAGLSVSISDDGLLPSGGTRALFRKLDIGPDAAGWRPHLTR
ncbi:hypothetical protein D7147_02100 [Micromonospora musae]|uniref:Uncharacterized protein n=1 Tax=Micromonospora musae TaxID=1894970 RepID=A0A3A9YI08_9ACTN|nr:hypothetical protein [Micromonospora musae]RKN23848.1 hypothetical protein D7147_02100 [Micromonospora musae]RKN31837.1 hypothetical protein D7044_16330 [Micromonospora musae]